MQQESTQILLTGDTPKYTPGPWEFTRWVASDNKDKTRHLTIHTSTDGKDVCMVFPSKGEYLQEFCEEENTEYTEEDHANASLLSAAPALLDVLVEILAKEEIAPALMQKAIAAINQACPNLFQQN